MHRTSSTQQDLRTTLNERSKGCGCVFPSIGQVDAYSNVCGKPVPPNHPGRKQASHQRNPKALDTLFANLSIEFEMAEIRGHTSKVFKLDQKLALQLTVTALSGPHGALGWRPPQDEVWKAVMFVAAIVLSSVGDDAKKALKDMALEAGAIYGSIQRAEGELRDLAAKLETAAGNDHLACFNGNEQGKLSLIAEVKAFATDLSLAEVKSDVQKLKGDVQQLNGDVQQLKMQVASNAENVARLDAGLAITGHQVEANRQGVEANSAAIVATRNGLDKAVKKEKVCRLIHADTHNELATEVETLREQGEAQGTAIDGLREDAAATREIAVSAGKKATDNSAQIELLQQTVDKVKAEVEVVRADMKASKAVEVELRERLESLIADRAKAQADEAETREIASRAMQGAVQSQTEVLAAAEALDKVLDEKHYAMVTEAHEQHLKAMDEVQRARAEATTAVKAASEAKEMAEAAEIDQAAVSAELAAAEQNTRILEEKLTELSTRVDTVEAVEECHAADIQAVAKCVDTLATIPASCRATVEQEVEARDKRWRESVKAREAHFRKEIQVRDERIQARDERIKALEIELNGMRKRGLASNAPVVNRM